MDASTPSATKSASFTSNLQYVAFTQSGSIYVGKLESPGVFEIHCRSLPPHPFGLRPILALSPLRPNLLSISTGSRTSIWNIEDDSPKCTIHDSERSVTSSAWSTHDGELLALGSFDHISLYNVDKPYKPQKVFLVGTGRCHSLSWSLDGLLAACCGHSLLFWDVTKSRESLDRSFDLGHSVSKIHWRPHVCGTILAVGYDGALEERKI
jgi:WD40 repeat protein